MASLMKGFWCDMMTLDCKSHYQHCVVYNNRAKTDRRGGVALQTLGVLEYPWEIVGIDYVTDLPKKGYLWSRSRFLDGLAPY